MILLSFVFYEKHAYIMISFSAQLTGLELSYEKKTACFAGISAKQSELYRLCHEIYKLCSKLLNLSWVNASVPQVILFVL